MWENTTRREMLKRTGAAAGILTMAGCQGEGDEISGETVKIGALQPISGDIAYYGQTGLMGLFSGLAHKYDTNPITELTSGTRTIEPDDGPTFEIFVEDTQFSPDTAQNVATDLVIDQDVDLLVGTSSSGSARRLAETVLPETDIPFVVGPAADANITASSEYCHDQLFRTSEHTAMDARAGGRYAAENTDISTVAMFAADYSFGYAVAENYRQVLEANGIEVLESRFVEQGYSEFAGLFDEAVDQGADAVVGGFTVATLPQFIGTAADYDLRILGAFATQISAGAMSATLENVLGADFTAEDIKETQMGPLTSRYHWNQYDNPINDEFIDMHIEAYGQVPDLFSSGTFTAGSAIVQAIRESGSTDGVDIAEQLRGMSITDTPKGEDAYQFQDHNNQAASAMTVAWPVPTSDEWADSWDAGVMPGEPVETLDPADVMVPVEEATCDLT